MKQNVPIHSTVTKHLKLFHLKGHVRLGGDWDKGQLGLGDKANRLALILVGAAAETAIGESQVLSVACSYFNIIIVTKDDALWTLDSVEYGALNHNNCNTRLVPARIEAQHFGNTKIVSVAGGFSHSAAVTEEDTLYTWIRPQAGARQRGGKVGAHMHHPKPAAGRARLAMPRSTANARPRLCYGHVFSAWQLHCTNRQWQQEAAVREGRIGSKARRWLLLTRARTVGMSRCRVSWCSWW